MAKVSYLQLAEHMEQLDKGYLDESPHSFSECAEKIKGRSLLSMLSLDNHIFNICVTDIMYFYFSLIK